MSTYLLLCVEFNFKQVIYDWQNWKIHLIKLILDFDQFVQEIIMREINNNENDELQIIDVKDEIEKEKNKKKKRQNCLWDLNWELQFQNKLQA